MSISPSSYGEEKKLPRSTVVPGFTLEGYSFSDELHRGKSTVILRGSRLSDGVAVVVKTMGGDRVEYSDIVRLRHEYSILSGISSAGVLRALGFE